MEKVLMDIGVHATKNKSIINPWWHGMDIFGVSVMKAKCLIRLEKRNGIVPRVEPLISMGTLK